MSAVLADSSFLVALLHDRDQWHAAARTSGAAALKKTPWRTHTLALGEVVAVLGPRVGGKAVRDAYEALRDTMDVWEPTVADMDAAMPDVVRHDGKLSLSDALFVLDGRRRGENEILSFDSGFDATALRRLPSKT
ncbi:MAG: PIN domain-containing protein [Thermoplasmatota archaeon]